MNVNITNPSKRHASRRAGGFTLVELLVVISIMLLMLKLTLPSLRGLMGSNKHAIAQSQLIGDLNRARTMALQNGFPVYVVFMPAITPADQNNPILQAYFENEGNSMLVEQSISYAIYAEKLPGDQPGDPSRRWLTDWKRLPEGFYFAKKDLDDITRLASSAGDPLTLPYLKNGHGRGVINMLGVFVERQMKLPYLMFNEEGELSVRGVDGGTRGNSFLLSITEGGVFQPAKDRNGIYSFEPAEPPDADPENRRRVWVQINSITGRADVWGEESAPVDQTKLHIDLEITAITINDANIPVMKTKIDEWILKNAKDEAENVGPWDPAWSNPDPNNQGRRVRRIDLGALPVKITGLPKGKYPVLVTFLRRIDPGIWVSSKRVEKK